MLRNKVKKGKYILILCLLIMLFFNIKITTFALEKNYLPEGDSSQEIEKGEIAPYAEWVDVPAYQYVLVHYNGAVTYKPIVYKQINVPSGCRVETSGPVATDWAKDAYYEGIKYKQVNKMEWTHKIVKM